MKNIFVKMRILLVGSAGSGKSTVANLLCEKYNFKEFALGDKLKELTFLLLKTFGIEINDVSDLYSIETKNRYRKYLQLIGTECCRKVFGDDFWCKQLDESLSKEENNNIVISDIRFINEFNYFNRRNDTISIRIDGRKFESSNEDNMYHHRSETELNEIITDYIIDNSKDIGYLSNQIDHIIDKTNDPLNDDDDDELGKNYEDIYEMVDSNTNGITSSKSLTEQRDCNPETTPACNDLKHTIVENKNTISSKEKGNIGEEAVCNLIQKINPKFDVIAVSSTGHLADIHAIDYENNIKYIIEVKYKQVITREDVTKFEKDVKTAEKSCDYKVVGLFLSINSDNIVSIGNYHIDFDMIYLTSKFINEQVLSMIFDIVPLHNKLLTMRRNQGDQIVKYEISPNVLHLIAQLRMEYASINSEKEIYMSMKSNSEKNLCFIQELLGKLTLKEQFIKLINTEFNDVLPVVSSSVSDEEEDKLRKYISTTNKKDIKKKNLLSMFPVLSTQLGSMKLQDILDKYGK